MNELRLYIAGKVDGNSRLGGVYNWRDEFCNKISDLSRRKISHLDPLSLSEDNAIALEIFRKDSELILESQGLVVYLSDDISVGGSQEILIAKYYKKPVIGYAPYGGKFNGCDKKIRNIILKNYKDPFVFATCDVVCGNMNELAEQIKNFEKIKAKSIGELLPGLS